MSWIFTDHFYTVVTDTNRNYNRAKVKSVSRRLLFCPTAHLKACRIPSLPFVLPFCSSLAAPYSLPRQSRSRKSPIGGACACDVTYFCRRAFSVAPSRVRRPSEPLLRLGRAGAPRGAFPRPSCPLLLGRRAGTGFIFVAQWPLHRLASLC